MAGKKLLRNFNKIAEEDSKGTWVKFAPKHAKPKDYLSALHSMGYSFTMNTMNDRVYINKNLMSDGMEAVLLTKLGNNGYV